MGTHCRDCSEPMAGKGVASVGDDELVLGCSNQGACGNLGYFCPQGGAVARNLAQKHLDGGCFV